MGKELLFTEIEINMKVVDPDGTKGVIIDMNDIHNVCVEFFPDGVIETGTGIYCLHKDCEEYYPLYLDE